MKKTIFIFAFLITLVFSIAKTSETRATEPGCSSTQLDNKVLTDVECIIPGVIQKRCLEQTNKCCDASQTSGCGHS